VHPFLKSKLSLVIGGHVVESASGNVLETLNPATGEVLACLAAGDATDVDTAVRAARAAFDGPWSKWKPYDRHALLMRVHDLVDARFEEMALLETLDMGSEVLDHTSTYAYGGKSWAWWKARLPLSREPPEDRAEIML
jgi:aldehyde dehydrogenase (NAD+)